MDKLTYKNPKDFSTRKVSIDRAIKVLNRNGIKVNREKAELILDFLYLLAKTFRYKEDTAIRT